MAIRGLSFKVALRVQAEHEGALSGWRPTAASAIRNETISSGSKKKRVKPRQPARPRKRILVILKPELFATSGGSAGWPAPRKRRKGGKISEAEKLRRPGRPIARSVHSRQRALSASVFLTPSLPSPVHSKPRPINRDRATPKEK